MAIAGSARLGLDSRRDVGMKNLIPMGGNGLDEDRIAYFSHWFSYFFNEYEYKYECQADVNQISMWIGCFPNSARIFL